MRGTRKQRQPLSLSSLRALRWISPEVVTARRNSGGGVLIFLLGATGGDKTAAVRALGRAARRPVSRVDVGRLLLHPGVEDARELPRVFDLARRARALLFLDDADSLFEDPGEREGTGRPSGVVSREGLWRTIEEHPGGVIIATASRPPLFRERVRRRANRSR